MLRKPIKEKKQIKSSTELFIQSLNRQELAYMYKYKFDSMMQHNKDILLQAMQKQGVLTLSIDEIIDAHKLTSSSDKGCPRCGSFRWHSFEIVSDHYNKYADDSWSGEMKKEMHQECSICGFSHFKKNEIDSSKYKEKKAYIVAIVLLIIILLFVYNLIK